MIGPRPDAAPTLVMLHEGLGCVGMWGDFPDKLAAATGCGVFVYSRAGYGKSSPVTLPRPLDYMHDEAQVSLPRLLERIGFRRGLLVGHSDGASIAAIYAGSIQDHRVRGLVLMAPHFICEDVSSEVDRGGARRLRRQATCARSLRTGIPMSTTRSAAGTMSGSRTISAQWDISEELAYIRVPILIVQGEDDQYGTVRQIEIAQEECYCPVDVALLPGAKHNPAREAPDVTLRLVSDFVDRMLREHEAEAA